MILSFLIVFIIVPSLYARTKRISCAIYFKHIWIEKENLTIFYADYNIDVHKSANIVLFSIFSILFIFYFC